MKKITCNLFTMRKAFCFRNLSQNNLLKLFLKGDQASACNLQSPL